MFRQIRVQPGELDEVAAGMRSGSIPCMDVEDRREYEWVLEQLASRGIRRLSEIPEDKTARDRIREPEFEFRAAFSPKESKDVIYYLDIYYEPDYERTYDSIGEI